MKLIVGCLFFPLLSALPQRTCPGWLTFSGLANDMGLLADAVSWKTENDVMGKCDNYRVTQTISSFYDTRMRLYQGEKSNNTFIVFRPSQQTPTGGEIHDERRTVKCSFFANCTGNVHDRFQRVFTDMIQTAGFNRTTLQYPLYVVGHSLGGALSMFMSIYLWNTYGIRSRMNLGLAGPFIGDDTFTVHHQRPLKDLYGPLWWQIESVDKKNPINFDGTAEQYQVGNNGIYIDYNLLCGIDIDPLPIPFQSYGMHDLKQYRLFFNGSDCGY